MRSRIVAIAAVAAAVSVGVSANRAAAFPPASPAKLAMAAWNGRGAQNIDCRCARTWGAREYWRWDHRPIWDDPWQVLKPNFWGSPEPHVVPADVWARKWRLRRPWRHRHWHPQ